MIFLEVKPELVKILNEYRRGKTLVDCGAGEGALGDAMNHRGIISIDLFEQPNPRVLFADCTTFPMPISSIPIFIRPCHSEFVHETIMNNLERCGKFLYIGLDKNLDNDLDMEGVDDGDGDYFVRHIFTDWVGPEGEKIWEISSKQFVGYEPKEWFFVANSKTPRSGGGWYCKDERGWFVNTNGGRSPISGSMTIIKQRFCLEEELDWTDSYLDRPEEDSGWLDRDGNFFGCRPQDHTEYATLILNTTMRNLEDHGWVHIYGEPGSQDHKPYGDFVCVGEDGMSDEQIRFLRSKGYKVSPVEERKKAKMMDNKTDWQIKEPANGLICPQRG